MDGSFLAHFIGNDQKVLSANGRIGMVCHTVTDQQERRCQYLRKELTEQLDTTEVECSSDFSECEVYAASEADEPGKVELSQEEQEEANKELEQLDTDSDEDYVTDFYTRTFRNIPVLTPEEEHHYATLLKTGTPEEHKQAKDTLVYHNMRYVLKIAGRYIGQGNDYDDLVQVGLIGLMRAIDKYDVDMGYRVTTYATWWIKQAITRDLADNSRTIRLPVHIQDSVKRIMIAERDLQAEGFSGDELIKQIAKKTGYPVEKVEQVRKFKMHLVSLDLKIGGEGNNDGESVLGDFVADERTKGQEEIIERMDMREELTHCMDSCLTGREKEVIRMRFGLDDGRPMTLEEIGSVMAVTRERVRQIEGKALHKLRNPKYVKHLKVYLE